jgi:flagellin
MAQVISTNIASINAQRNLYKSGLAMHTAMERLSSGLRINSAKDDAAGLAIADRMSSQIKGLNQAQRNANDGISVSQVAEGALGEVTGVLQRMRELAVQAANDTNTASDRLSIQKEVSQLQQEISRIATQTQFNGKNVLNGDFVAQKFQIGAYSEQTISFSIGSARATDIGANSLDNTSTSTSGTAANATSGASVWAITTSGANGASIANQTLTITGSTGTPTTVAFASGTGAAVSAKTAADAVNGASASTNVNATAVTKAYVSGLSVSGTFVMSLYGSNEATSALASSGGTQITATITNTNDLSALSDAINNVASSTGITAALSADKASLTLTQSQGYNIGVENFRNANGVSGSANGQLSITTVDATSVSTSSGTVNGVAGFTLGRTSTITAGSVSSGSAAVVGTVSFSSSAGYSITTSTSGTFFGASTESSSLDNVANAKVTTQLDANDAIKRIDGALNFVDDLRGTLGAVQNRFSSAISSMQVTVENVSAARSRVQDTDFAAETAELSRTQILQQAGTAMLSQANASTQNVLSLLR